jgi:hypothetical protein
MLGLGVPGQHGMDAMAKKGKKSKQGKKLAKKLAKKVNEVADEG